MSRSGVPAGSRPAARVLLLDPDDRLLLLQARDSVTRHHWWVAPGGGLEPDESFDDAARREAFEETGLTPELGPWVWTRRHVYEFEGRPFDQYERYFVGRVLETALDARKPDSYIVAARWWSQSELQLSSDDFTPRRLAELIVDIVAERYPSSPIDCGI